MKRRYLAHANGTVLSIATLPLSRRLLGATLLAIAPILALTLTTTGRSLDVAAMDRPTAAEVSGLGSAPPAFEANKGQTDRSVRFVARGAGSSLFLTKAAAVLVAGNGGDQARSVFRMSFVGAGNAPRIRGLERLPGKVNYFRAGVAPRRVSARTFARVRYQGLYPGVDVDFYGQPNKMEYDVRIAPGADPHGVAFSFGRATTSIGRDGTLRLRAGGRELRHSPPVAYQHVGGKRRLVASAFELRRGGIVGFRLGRYDLSRPLVIDPTIDFSTVLGGAGLETGQGLAVDKDGYIYVAGETESLDFPTTDGAYQRHEGGTIDAFVAKLDPTASRLIYATYLGGVGWDAAHRESALAIDRKGAAYVTGFTTSPTVDSGASPSEGEAPSHEFPTTPGAFDRQLDGPMDAFVTKLSPDGDKLVYSTFLGGSSIDGARVIEVDRDGAAYVTGMTGSADFPSADNTLGGVLDAYVAKLNPQGSDVEMARYLGGSADEDGQGLALDGAGNLYVMGLTRSSDFPTTPGAFQTRAPSSRNYFVTKFRTEGGQPVYSTFLGGSGDDGGGPHLAGNIDVDGEGHAYVIGSTQSNDFPVKDAYQQERRGAIDTFVAKLAPAGNQLLWATYLGGTGDDGPNSIVVDDEAHAHVVGNTTSSDFPTERPFQAQNRGAYDAYVTKFDPAGQLAYSSYFGGWGFDSALVAVLHRGHLYVTGVAGSPRAGDLPAFPTTRGAFSRDVSGAWDAFAARISGP